MTLEAEDGACGLGVAAPLPGYSDETLDDAIAEVERFAAFVSATPFSWEALQYGFRKTPVMLPSVRFALETAALSLEAARGGLSLSDAMAGRTKRERAKQINVAKWLSPEEDLEACADFPAVKIKVGLNLDEELRIVRELHAVFPHKKIRVDANRSLDAQQAASFANALLETGVEYFEEPSDPETLLSLQSFAVPLALDETLTEARALQVAGELLAAHKVAALSIKPTRLGDLRNCLFWCDFALQREMAPIVSHCLEPRLGYEACTAVASLFPSFVHGLAPHGACAEVNPPVNETGTLAVL